MASISGFFCNGYIREMMGSYELSPAEDVTCGYYRKALHYRDKANYLGDDLVLI